MRFDRAAKLLAALLTVSTLLSNVQPALTAFAADDENDVEIVETTQQSGVETTESNDINTDTENSTGSADGSDPADTVEDSTLPTDVTEDDESSDGEPAPQDDALTLHSGTVTFTGKEDAGTVKAKLAAALLDGNYDLSGIEFEYYCEGKSSTGLAKNTAWGSVNGFESQTGSFIKTTYTHPALKDNSDGNYQVRLADTTEEVTVTKKTLTAEITVNKNVSVAMPYNEDGSVNFAALRQAILDAAVAESTPILTAENTTIEYYAENVIAGRPAGTKSWMPLEGGTKNLLTYPAISTDSQTIKITFNGDDDLASASAEVTIDITERTAANITVPENAELDLVFNDDMSVNYDAVREAILAAVGSDVELTAENTTIEYYATATSGSVGSVGKAWMPLEGGTKNMLTYPAMGAGSQQIKLTFKGNAEYTDASVEANIKFNDRPEAEMTMAEGTEMALVFNDDLSVNYDAVRNAILAAVQTDEDLVLTADNTTIEYHASPVTGSVTDADKNWVPLEGGTAPVLGVPISYPAMSAGEQKIKVSFAGDLTYKATSREFTVKFNERPEAFELNEGASVTLRYNDDATVDYADLRAQIVESVVNFGENKELTVEDLKIENYAAPKTNINDAGKQWMPLEGGFYKVPVLGFEVEFEAIKEGLQTIRVSYAGDIDTAPTTKDVEITVLGRPELEVTVNDGAEVGFAFNDDMGYNYEGTAANIIKAVIAGTEPEVESSVFTVEYNASLIGSIKDWKPLNNNDITNLKKFGEGEWEIRISWNGTKDYKDGSAVVNISMIDARIESVVAVNENASFIYNMNGDVMKQAIFDNVIDWNNSVLPARDTLSTDNFEMTYKALPKQLDDIVARVGGLIDLNTITDALKMSVPVEGMTISVNDIPAVGGLLGGLLGDIQMLEYPSIGAGSQQITISYKGNPEYRPSAVETNVNIAKARVSVSVQWTNIRAGQPMPENFITTNPADNFNIYTIYTGITSNVSLGIYIDLPDAFTDGPIMKVIDPVVNGIFGKTMTQMLQDGMSVGDLRQMFRTQELLDLLSTLGVDTSALSQVLNILDSIGGIVDGIRVSFGVPNRAGLYSAIAITENKNYEVGVGYGTILVRMNTSGVKLNWNQAISGSMTSAQAKEFDFGVTLSVDGDVTVNQSNVHYLYSGLTSKFRIYSSTTTAPTEPGSYVVTVVTLGGDYLAAPITRSFRITK